MEEPQSKEPGENEGSQSGEERRSIVPLSGVESLLDIVLEGQDVEFSPEQQESLKRLTRRQVAAEPGSLRICSRQCPVHDDCPWIISVSEDQRPYNQRNKRCRVEAELYQSEFQTAVEYVRSLDPAYDSGDPSTIYDPPAVELTICRDLAFHSVVVRRLREEMAADPRATIEAAIPGGRGSTKKEENPAIVAWTRAVDKKNRLQDRLTKLVESRLKRVTSNKKLPKAMERIRDLYEKKKKEGLDDDNLNSFLMDTSAKIDEMKQKRKAKGKNETSDGGGDRHEPSGEVSD